MPKLLYLVHCPRDLALDAFLDRIETDLKPRLLAGDPMGLKLSTTRPGISRPLWLPTVRQGLALVSLWTRDAAETSAWTERVRSLSLPTMGYRVSESTARSYERTWPDGQDSPGITLLTLFRRRRGLGREEFVRRWHEGHSPHALRFHPMWNYLRNIVDEVLTEKADPWGGIVEEQYREVSDVNDPRRFFRGTLHILPRLAATLVQTNRFLDLFTLQSYILVERIVRTPTP